MTASLSDLAASAVKAVELTLEAIADLRGGADLRLSVVRLRASAEAKLMTLVTALRRRVLTGDAESVQRIVLANVPRFELFAIGVLDRGEIEAMRQTLLLAKVTFEEEEAMHVGDTIPSPPMQEAVGG